MSTPRGVLEGLWAEGSGYRTPPRSTWLTPAVLPSDADTTGDVLAQSETSFWEQLHSAKADVFTSRGFAGFVEGDGVVCPAIDMGSTFLIDCWVSMRGEAVTEAVAVETFL